MKLSEFIGTIAGSLSVFLIGLFIVIKHKNKLKKAQVRPQPPPQQQVPQPQQQVPQPQNILISINEIKKKYG